MRLTSLIALLTLLATAAAAADIEIAYTEKTLDNGLRVIVHEDHKSPVVAVNIWYHVGSKNEVAGRTGFAHLFEHLMFQGSENFDQEYLPFLQEIGATDLNATTWFDRTNYFQTVPVNALDTVLWIESDRMGHFAGAITQDKLDEQRGVVQNEKRQGENQPYGKVFETLLPQLFPPDHPYSWETIGSMADLDAATLDDVRDWFRTWYGPDNAVLAIAGDVDTADVIARVEKFFGDIPPGAPLTRPAKWVPSHDSDRRIRMQDRVPQARIYLSWVGPEMASDDAVYLALAAEIIGGGKNSRLFERLVYNDQIATDAELATLPLEIAGISYLAASAQPDAELAQVEAAAREELQRFIARGPTARELERVKTQYRARFLRGIESVGGSGGKAGILAQGAVYAGDPAAYRRELELVAGATGKQLRDAAARWLGPGAIALEVLPQPAMRASAGSVERSAGPPAPGAFPEVGFPGFERRELDNGLKVLISRRDDLPLVEFALIVDSGFAADQFGRPGTAALTLGMLDEGTSRRTALEISEALAMQGASLGAGAGLDTATVSLSALTANLDASLALYADVILNPVFPEAELERLRRSGIARIRQEKQRPVSMALRLMPELLYGPGHPYAQPLTGSGTEADLNAITRDELAAFHDTWFRPNNSTLVVVGDIDTDALIGKLEKLFGNWTPATVPVKALDAQTRSGDHILYIVDRPGAEQSVIFAGQLIPPRANPDEIAIQALNDVLGGQSTARINMNLREDKHWSYGAFTLIVDARGPRPWLAYAPVQTDKTRESVAELLREYREIRGPRPATAAELQTVVRSDTLSLPGRWERGGSVLDSLAELVRYGLPDDYWSSYTRQVTGLQLTDVNSVAEALVQPERLTWVVVGDRASIEAGLGDLGFTEVRLIDADGTPLSP